MGDPEPTRVVVTDANVLINLIHVDRLALLGTLAGFEFVVPPEVVAEVSIPDHSAALASALDAGHLQPLSFERTAELKIYAEHVHARQEPSDIELIPLPVRPRCRQAPRSKKRFGSRSDSGLRRCCTVSLGADSWRRL